MIVLDLRKLKTCDLSFYLALEEYLINKKDSNEYFFLWDIDKSIIIGKNQLVETEVNLDFVKEYGFKVFRRPSGGGAIYADSGDFMFSFITNHKDKDEMFNYSLNKILNVLNKLNIDAKLSGRNDLIFLNKKFSGSAIYYKQNKTVLHGTFLYDANLDLLEKFLTPSSDKLISKGISSVKSRVINLKPYLNLSKDELMDYFLYHIDNDIKITELNDIEIEEVNKIKIKYDDESLIYNKKPPYSFHNHHRFNFGEVEIYIDINNGIIKDIKITGDFFTNNDLDSLYLEFINKRFSDINNIINNIDINNYIIGMTNLDLLKLLDYEKKEN